MDPVSLLLVGGVLNVLVDRLREWAVRKSVKIGESLVEEQIKSRIVKPAINRICRRVFGREPWPSVDLKKIADDLRLAVEENSRLVMEEHEAVELVYECVGKVRERIEKVDRTVVALQQLIISESGKLRVWLSGELEKEFSVLCMNVLREVQGYTREQIEQLFVRIDARFDELEEQHLVIIRGMRELKMIEIEEQKRLERIEKKIDLERKLDEVLRKQDELLRVLRQMGVSVKLPMETELVPSGSVEEQRTVEIMAKNFKKEVEKLEKEGVEVPINVEAYKRLGVLYLQGGKAEDAKKYFEDILKVNNRDVDAWIGLGRAYIVLKQYEEAIECVENALKIEPESAEAWFYLGLAYHEAKNYKLAIECYNEVIKISPKSEDAWVNKGVALDRLGRLEEAIRCYDKVIYEINPKSEKAWFNKGVALFRLGKYEEAIRCFDRAIEINPESEDAWFSKGLALDKLGRHKEAEKCFRKSIEPGY